MVQVGVHAAKTNLSRLLNRAASGEEVVILRAGIPVARLVPIARRGKRRVAGQDKGKVWISPDFDRIPEEFEPYLK